MSVAHGLPTLSQIESWETAHLDGAARRWTATAERWESSFGLIADGVRSPNGTHWEGDAQRAAQARADKDREGVRILVDRLRTAARTAVDGGSAIEAAKHEALTVIAATDAMGFDIAEDLTVSSRMGAALRRTDAVLLGISVRTGAAQLAAVDHAVAAELDSVTAGFDALNFGEGPVIAPIATGGDGQSFGQCFSDNFKDDIGENMVQGVFVGGALGALRGAVLGVLGGPLGMLGGSVAGFVGGAAGGAMISGPARTAVTSAWDCL